MNEKVGLCRILDDLAKGIEWCEVSFVAFFSFVLSFWVYSINVFSLETLQRIIYDLVPNLIGFSLTIYVVLFSLGKFITERLEGTPFEVLHATFVGGILIQILTLFVIFILDIAECDKSIYWVNVSICFLLSFSLIWLVNMLFHLYSLRTFMK